MDPIKITAQLNTVKTLKDGGGRITLEFGLESLKEVHRLQNINGNGQMNFLVVCVPINESRTEVHDKWELGEF